MIQTIARRFRTIAQIRGGTEIFSAAFGVENRDQWADIWACDFVQTSGFRFRQLANRRQVAYSRCQYLGACTMTIAVLPD